MERRRSNGWQAFRETHFRAVGANSGEEVLRSLNLGKDADFGLGESADHRLHSLSPLFEVRRVNVDAEDALYPVEGPLRDDGRGVDEVVGLAEERGTRPQTDDRRRDEVDRRHLELPSVDSRKAAGLTRGISPEREKK